MARCDLLIVLASLGFLWLRHELANVGIDETRVRWDWEMYGVGTDVDVKAIEHDKRILMEWDGPERTTQIEWTFEEKGRDRTFVQVKNWGFAGEPSEAAAEAIASTEGFTFVLAALKAFLEHDLVLDVVLDHSPDALVDEWQGRSARHSSEVVRRTQELRHG